MKYNFLKRSRVIFFGIALFALILVGKLFSLQVIHNTSYSDRADRQYVTPSSNIFERGTIYFSRKDGQLVSAAMQATGFKVAIDPEKISNDETVYQELLKIIPDLSHDDFIAKASKENDPYEEVANGLTKDQADAISALKITGVSIYKEKWRFYPGGNLASQTLGFVGYKGNDLAGRYGLERQYNGELSRDKDNPYVNFFAEVFSNLGKTIFSDESKEGDVVTSIEPTVQSFLEKTLENVKEKYQVDSVGGIIMNPKDGSIYALGSKPDFDPNNFSKVEDISEYTNPLVESIYEFGSVVKPLIMAGAIDSGVLDANTTYNDKGSVTIENHVISNFDKRGRGPGTTMQDVLTQSLNTGMVFVEEKMGKENMKNYLLSYGIKDKTGIDLPNETGSLISILKNYNREIEYANASFGQGIAMTPMELLRALGSLANEGNLVVPHVVDKIRYDDGTEKDMTYGTTPTKISKATAEEITRMLVNVMDKNLGGRGKLTHYSIAAKTGTAQVAKPGGGGYYEDRHTHSFFGYLPAYNPRFIIFLYAVNPKGVPYAIETWADPFLNIANFLVNYYEVPPDR